MAGTSAEIGPRPSVGARDIRVWDIFVRVGHWLLVLLFFLAYFTGEDALAVHVWAGYGVGIYLLVRIVWGFVGSRHARFRDFCYGIRLARRYLWDLFLFRARRYLGHSPAGAMMVFALLMGLAASTLSGTALLAVEENSGPLAPWLGSGTTPEATVSTVLEKHEEGELREKREGESALEEIHELSVNLTLLLVILHVIGVVLASVVHRENLVRAMVTGRKRIE
jgi:cytochrome b